MKTITNLTDKEKQVLTFLHGIASAHGVTLRIAGGFVRDRLLGIESHDIDIAVQGMSGAGFAQVIANALGKKITVIEARPEQSKHLETAMLEVMGLPIDFAGLRSEEYGDSRIPVVKEGTPEEDAKRRDLTVNALFYNIGTGEIEDYVGGLDDLTNGVANTPMDSTKTFIDDPLRVLRVIRFAAKYGFKIGDTTKEAMRDKGVHEALSNKISKERIWAELFGVQEGDSFKTGFLTGPNPHKALEIMFNSNLEDVLFSPVGVELNPWDTEQNNPHHDMDIINHTLWAIQMGHHDGHFPGHIENFSKSLGFLRNLNCIDKGVVTLALMLHDLGKRDPGCIQLKADGFNSYLGHDDRSVELADIVLDQLGAHKAIKSRVLRLIKHHMRYHVLEDKPSGKALRKIVRDMEEDWRLLILHSKADSMGKLSANYNEMAHRYDTLERMTEEAIVSMGTNTKVLRPINGHDLAVLGIPKGPTMGEVFAALDEALLENPEMSSDEAKAFCLILYKHESLHNAIQNNS